jgi:hypothetical protein
MSDATSHPVLIIGDPAGDRVVIRVTGRMHEGAACAMSTPCTPYRVRPIDATTPEGPVA